MIALPSASISALADGRLLRQARSAVVDGVGAAAHLLLQAFDLPLQRRAFVLQLLILLQQLPLHAPVQLALGVQLVPLLGQGFVPLVVAPDLVAAGDERVGFLDAPTERLGIRADLLPLCAETLQHVAELGGFAGARFQGRQPFSYGRLRTAGGLDLGPRRLHLFGHLGALDLPRRLGLEGRLQPLDLGVGPVHGVGRGPLLGPCPLGQAVVLAQVQDAGEDLLALARTLLGELVRAALEQKSRVDEGIVVDPEDAVEDLLRLAQAAPGERTEVGLLGLVDRDLEVRPARLARGRARVRPHDAVPLALQIEHELHLHVLRADADEVGIGLAVVAALAALAEERPRDRIEQRRLPLPVPAREAGDVELLEVERGGGGPVAEKVRQTELDRDHGNGLLRREGETAETRLPNSPIRAVVPLRAA